MLLSNRTFCALLAIVMLVVKAKLTLCYILLTLYLVSNLYKNEFDNYALCNGKNLTRRELYPVI